MNGDFFPSVKWRRQLRDSDVSRKAILLGLLISTYANHKTGQMRPSLPLLRAFFVNDDEHPVTDRTIKRWRRQLVDAGYLKLVKKGDGRGHASVYQLTFPAPRNGDTNGDRNGDTTPPETGTGVVPPSAGEVQVLPSGEQELRNGDEVQDLGLTASVCTQVPATTDSASADSEEDLEAERERYREVFRLRFDGADPLRIPGDTVAEIRTNVELVRRSIAREEATA